ncbi:MAG TPA: carbohydrate-binding protein [Candidatus Acidoferrum sp.]|nr:carbohydrate-binding protein [Candidatus Acidoferrum sp.]
MSPNQVSIPPAALSATSTVAVKLMTAAFSLSFCLVLAGCSTTAHVNLPTGYQGKAFHDTVYHGGPQKIPGMVYCAYYDLGGEGVAYHDNTATNLGSGVLNPANGTYLNEFRMTEAVDISYVKLHDAIDNNPFNLVPPPDQLLYVGWTEPGEWFNLTVDVASAGVYTFDLLYTSHQGGAIALDLNGRKLTEAKIVSTYNAADPLAWRQWHHWNLLKDAAEVKLPKGVSVLTVRILAEGNMNLAYLNFRRK